MSTELGSCEESLGFGKEMIVLEEENISILAVIQEKLFGFIAVLVVMWVIVQNTLGGMTARNLKVVQQLGLIGATQFVKFSVAHVHIVGMHKHNMATLIDLGGLCVLGLDRDVARVIRDARFYVLTWGIVVVQ